jgi:hypothetical protein
MCGVGDRSRGSSVSPVRPRAGPEDHTSSRGNQALATRVLRIGFAGDNRGSVVRPRFPKATGARIPLATSAPPQAKTTFTRPPLAPPPLLPSQIHLQAPESSNSDIRMRLPGVFFFPEEVKQFWGLGDSWFFAFEYKLVQIS